MSRRSFLTGMSLGLSASAAASMVPMSAMASESGRPQRFLTYFVPHGWPIEWVDNFGTGSGWLNDSYVLSRFSKFEDKVLVPRGVSMPGGGHHGAHHCLTGKGHGHTSLDVKIAESMGTQAWVTGVASYDYASRLNFQGGHPMNPIGKPLDFIDDVFGKTETIGGGVSETQFRTALFDMSEGQLERLSNSVQGLSKQRSRLSDHIDSVREVKALANRDLSAAALNSDINAMRERHAHTANLDDANYENTTAILNGHIDAMAAGLTSGAVRVGTLRIHSSGGQFTSNFKDGPGIAGNAHMNSHASNLDRRKREYAGNLNWFLDRLVTLMERLDVPDPLDPGRTVLENTTILYTSEMADGGHVGNAGNINRGGQTLFTYMPYVILGGCAGKIRTGRAVDVNCNHNDILATLAHSHGSFHEYGSLRHDLLA